MLITRLQSADAAPYRQLMLEAYALAADAFTATVEERAAEPLSFWVRRLADPAGLSAAFGAFDGPQLVGTVALQCSARPKTRHKAQLIGMYLAASARGQGIAQALLEAAAAHARAQAGIALITLTVTEGNEPALRLYRRAGFQTFGIEPMAVCTRGGFKAKVHMWLPVGPAAASA